MTEIYWRNIAKKRDTPILLRQDRKTKNFGIDFIQI